MHRASRKTRLQRPEGIYISYDTAWTLCLDTGPRISKDPGVWRPKILYVEPEFQGGTLLRWREASGDLSGLYIANL